MELTSKPKFSPSMLFFMPAFSSRAEKFRDGSARSTGSNQRQTPACAAMSKRWQVGNDIVSRRVVDEIGETDTGRVEVDAGETNSPGWNQIRIPTGQAQESPAKWALFACSPLVNHHREGCESAGGQSTTRESVNGEQAWP
ncbi:hypothetical protein [Bradyrhizobium sp. RDI18]|uniref:hypothetical protein n=1 Tax=Bradyrhizobium sp. RDI18 TaxID=3367400 RepID=UPI0037203F9F